MAEKILIQIRKDLKNKADNNHKIGAIRFFKEKINPLGVRTPIVRKIANQYYQQIKNLPKTQIFYLCENLLAKKTFEETLIAFAWLDKSASLLKKEDFKYLEQWLKKYVNNWAFCDDFCTHVFGKLILKYPELLSKIKPWTRSKNRWERRASAVILIPLSKQKKYLKNIFETADILLMDTDDLVQKGYGWSLKVASNHFPKEVLAFVTKRKTKMPRTALRYAIEKFPQKIRQKALK